MFLERISGLPASVRKDAEHIDLVSIGSTVTSSSLTGDVESPQLVPTIKGGAQMLNRSPFASSSASHTLQQPRRRSEILIVEDDSSSSEGSSVVEIVNPKPSPAKNRVRSSQRFSASSKNISASIPSSQSPSTSKPRVRVEVGNLSTKKATSKPLSTVLPQSRSGQRRPSPISIKDKPSVSKKPKTRNHAPLDAPNVLNQKSRQRPPSPPAVAEASTSRVDLPVFAYDLDHDPTEEVYELRVQIYDWPPNYSKLSARFIHPHLFDRPSDSSTTNDELTKSDGDLVAEFIEPAAIDTVGPNHEVTPSYSVDSTEVLGNSHPPSGSGDLDLEGSVQVMDSFTLMTMDDIINQHQPSVIDPSLLGGPPAFLETRSPSPYPLTFRNLHSLKKAPTPLPPPNKPALAIRVPTYPPTSGSSSANALGDSVGHQSGGKAKFYKKGTLQTPPYLSNPQSQRSKSAKVMPSTYVSRYPSPHQTVSPGVDSPLTEFNVSDFPANGTASTSSVATSSEAANIADEEPTVISSGSSTPPPRVTKKTTARTQKSSASGKGPYRIVATNEDSFCHQCRRSTRHPKMHCRACAKRYCILCIVKRYHHIEFQQFKKDFDCPACLDECNCTSCCDKRKEVYVTTRHIKFDAETMAKLLSGEIRSLPQLSASVSGPSKGVQPGRGLISSNGKEPLSAAGKGKAPARRKRIPNRRYISDDDDYDDDDYDMSKSQNAGVRVKPAQAALQTRRMLQESGSGKYWGAVYSLSGERIGMSYVGNNLQEVTVQTAGSSSVSIRDYSPFQKRGVYVGRWQDAWGPCPEGSEGSHSEGERYTNRRSRSKKGLGRARLQYAGNQGIIKAWRRAQSKAVQSPPVVHLPSSDGIEIYVPPSDPPPFDRACDRPEAMDAPQNFETPIDEEDEDGGRGYWTMEDELWPKATNFPLVAPTNVSGPGLGNANDALDVCPTFTLESCEQLFPQQALAEVVASSLEAVGAAVLLPRPTPSLSDFSY